MSERVKWCLGGHRESQDRDEAATQNLAGPEGCFSSKSESLFLDLSDQSLGYIFMEMLSAGES